MSLANIPKGFDKTTALERMIRGVTRIEISYNLLTNQLKSLNLERKSGNPKSYSKSENPGKLVLKSSKLILLNSYLTLIMVKQF